jgi:H+/Na+-translocating ferredoxin:NAD+ oxidoreductase subunit B
MLAAVLSLTLLGMMFGFGLGFAARRFAVEGDPLVEELTTMMPGSNCGQCGFPGCSAAAAAVADGSAAATCCPPGGKGLAVALAAKLGITLDLSAVADDGPKIAAVREEICIGCCRCIKVCPTDAIVGAPKQIHNVIREACTGCGACVERCPTEAVSMSPVPVTLQHWVWPKPAYVPLAA